MCQGLLDRTKIVEVGDSGGRRGVHSRRYVAWTRSRMIMLVQNDECFVHAAVIAVGEDQDLAAPGDQAGEPDRPPIRVRRRERGRPAWQAETATELSADPLGVFGG